VSVLTSSGLGISLETGIRTSCCLSSKHYPSNTLNSPSSHPHQQQLHPTTTSPPQWPTSSTSPPVLLFPFPISPLSPTNHISEHGGLKQDGTPDKRVGTGEFAQGKVDPHEAGVQGGKTSGSGADSSADTGSSGGNSGGSAKGRK
jgi:hypothetical protein